MKKIGLISDTHGTFDSVLKEFLSPVDEIWHAGDFGSIDTADQIAAFRPLRGVYGNIDSGSLRREFAETLVWNEQGVKTGMLHQGGYPGRYTLQASNLIADNNLNLLIAGHSHILKVMRDTRHDNLIFINPGAAGRSGFHRVRTAVRFLISDSRIRDIEIGEWPK